MSPSRDIRLRTDRLVLRPTERGDAQRLTAIQSNWNVTRMLRLAPWPPSEPVMTVWLGEHAQEWMAGTAYRFAVTEGGQVIGVVDLDGLADGTGDLGYWYDEPWWGGGYATEAAQAVVAFAFGELGLAALTAGHALDNPASGRVLEKLGFRAIRDDVRFSGPRGEEIPYRFLELHAGPSVIGAQAPTS